MKTRIGHCLRSYGASGGEQQLRRLFDRPQPGAVECFAGVWADPVRWRLFSPSPLAEQIDLLPLAPRPRGARREMLLLAPLLLVAAWRLGLWCWSRRIRVCWVHGFQAAVVAWLPAMLLRGVRFVYVHRVTKVERAVRAHRILYHPFRAVGGNSVAVAQSMRPFLPGRRALCLPNGIDDAAIRRRAGPVQPPLTTHRVVCVGRLMQHKRQHLVVEAVARLRRTDVELLLLGDGPTREALRAQADAAGLGERLVLAGRCDDVPARLAGSTIFVHASDREGLSNAVLEAMAVGLPSVVVDAPGVSECHCHGETGLVVAADATALAAAIDRLLDDAPTRQAMGAAARARVGSAYSMAACRRRYARVAEALA